MNQHVELLQAHGFSVIEDGSAVIVISDNERQERTAVNYSNSLTIARRYESSEQAVRILLADKRK